MFFVINKEKVYSYIVTLSMIGVLFSISAVYPKEALDVSTQNLYNNERNIENYIESEK